MFCLYAHTISGFYNKLEVKKRFSEIKTGLIDQAMAQGFCLESFIPLSSSYTIIFNLYVLVSSDQLNVRYFCRHNQTAPYHSSLMFIQVNVHNNTVHLSLF